MKVLLRAVVTVCIVLLAYSCSQKSQDPTSQELQEKAKAGDARAHLKLAQRYEAGVKGLPKDEEEAFQHYKKAAELGLIEGQFRLAICYEMGRGVEKDSEAARTWMQKAANGKSDDHREKMAIEQAKNQL